MVGMQPNYSKGGRQLAVSKWLNVFEIMNSKFQIIENLRELYWILDLVFFIYSFIFWF